MALTNKPVQIVWFRKDLRTRDHQVLATAAEHGPLVCLYVFEHEIVRANDHDSRHHQFIVDGLRDLKTDLATLGLQLNIRDGDILAILQDLQLETRFAALWSHHEVGTLLSRTRDDHVQTWCDEHGIIWRQFDQIGIRLEQQGRSGWEESWQKWATQPLIPAPVHAENHPLRNRGVIKTASDLGIQDLGAKDIQKGGSSTAADLLESFLRIRGLHFERSLNNPTLAAEHGSRLAPHLAHGTISLRDVYQHCRARHDGVRHEGAGARWRTSLSAFMDRLRWYSHFNQRLEDRSELEVKNYIQAYDGLRESEWNAERFETFAAGRTGFPMVDASIRCLNATGWLNFRMRALLVSFACNDLWLDWRPVSRLLAAQLTDYQPGVHYNQVQIQAGVAGVRNLRIYSPARQQMDQDREGVFVKRWLPELEGIPAAELHNLDRIPVLRQKRYGCVIGEHYPVPMVDHDAAAKRAETRLRQVQGTEIAREQAVEQGRQHGLRRRGRRASG